MAPNKTCPVVYRLHDGEIEVLAFRHPLAGLQLVKGTIEPGETEVAAAVRELYEEAGISHEGSVTSLGVWQTQYETQVWSFQLVPVAASTPDTWKHYTRDGEGLVFKYFWHPLRIVPDAEWHPLFQGALEQLRTLLPPILARKAAKGEGTELNGISATLN